MGFFKCASGGSLVLTFITLGVILALLWSIPERAGDSGCQLLCLPCQPNTTDTNICCDCRSKSLNAYLDKSYQQQLQQIENQEEATRKKTETSIQMKSFLEKTHWTIKPAARLTGTTQPESRAYDRGMFPIRAWKEGQRSFRRYGIQYRNGRLIVPIPGTYNIYSYLDLYESANPRVLVDKNVTGLIEHQMVKYNIRGGEEDVLVSNVRPHEIPKNDHFNIYDSYLSAAVRLDAGDEVYVKVSNLSYIKSPSSNYFGVHMI